MDKVHTVVSAAGVVLADEVITMIHRKRRIAPVVADAVRTRTMTATHNLSRCMVVSKWEAMAHKPKQLRPSERTALTPTPLMVATIIMSPCGMLLWPNSSNKARAKVSLNHQGPRELSA